MAVHFMVNNYSGFVAIYEVAEAGGVSKRLLQLRFARRVYCSIQDPMIPRQKEP